MEAASPAFDNLADNLSARIRSAGSEDSIRSLDFDITAIEESLAISIFNVHLLGRAQVSAEVQGGIVARDRDSLLETNTPAIGTRQQATGRGRARATSTNNDPLLAKLVLESGFEPLPFDEAIEFFSNKVSLTKGQFDDLADAARAQAFTVASGASNQVRESIQGMLTDALAEGITLPEFTAGANEILDRAGVSAATPWYWETVYRTNLQTSYQVGRWKQLTDPDVKAARPFLRYISARLPSSRPSHVEKHDLVFPVDDPFWSKWYPLNGFRCQCTVQTLSESLMNRRGLSVSTRRSFLYPEPDEGFRSNPGIGAAI